MNSQSINRYQFVTSHVAVIAVLICLAAFSPKSAVAVEQPNILIILCDDLGYGDLACYGHESIKTPNLDQLAADGIRFTDCYSASPLCSPARAGLLTGRTPSRAGIYSWIPGGNPMHLRKDETTIATLLKSNGYDTCHSGKWHLNGKFNNPEQTQPGDHGFDHWFSTQNNAGPSHRDPNNFVRNGEPVGPLKGFSCELVAEESIHWLKSRKDQSRPFFLFNCFHEPHEPIDSPDDLVAHYPQATKKGEALYYANVENMDRAVGKLLAALKELKIEDETLVVFTSDNGPETLNRYKSAWRSHGSPGPLRGMKLHTYDGGIRVAGIVRWNSHIEPGQTIHEPVCSVDLLPTLCELTGTPLPTSKPLDGTSLLPLLHGDKKLTRSTPLFWHFYGGTDNKQVAVRDGKWKLVAGWDGDPKTGQGGSYRPNIVPLMRASKLVTFELYNVSTDIGETTEVSKENPEIFNRLKTFAQDRYAEVLAEGPDWSKE